MYKMYLVPIPFLKGGLLHFVIGGRNANKSLLNNKGKQISCFVIKLILWKALEVICLILPHNRELNSE